MSVKFCCCLCYTPSYDFKIIQNEMGESTEIYDVTVKYFDPMILTDDQTDTVTSSTEKVLCSECWSHINDFHDFQQTVLKNRALFCGSIDQGVQQMIVLPTENKEFLSEDDFSDKEPIGFDSDVDDIPLTKLFKTEKLAQPDKENQTKTRRNTIRNARKAKNEKDIDLCTKRQSNEYDRAKGYSMLVVENDNIGAENLKKSSLSENEIEIPTTLNLKEESLTDDERVNSVRTKKESPTLKVENEILDMRDNLAESDTDDCGKSKPTRRGRKPKHLMEEENSSRKKGASNTVDKKLKSIRKKKIAKLPKKLKDPNKRSYMDKCRENDSFIAQWKPNLDCDLCSATATNFNALRDHFRDVHSTRCYIKCCDRKFYRRCVLMDHISLHINPETHKCDICGKSSTTKHNLKLHKQVMHGNLNQFECEVCHRQFNQKPTLDRHLLTHVKGENKFFCKECDRGYVLEIQLNSHVKTVHGVDCVCDQCGKTFHGVNALKKHLMDHAGVPKRKYPCDICGTELNTNNNLRRHKAAYHHDGSTAYICSVCGKVSSSENALRAHKKRVHEENRKHKCTYCDKAFKRPKDLREHVATHTGVDLYQCPHCPQTFKVSANMHHHRKRAHPVEWEEARRNRLHLPKVNIMEVTNQVVL